MSTALRVFSTQSPSRFLTRSLLALVSRDQQNSGVQIGIAPTCDLLSDGIHQLNQFGLLFDRKQLEVCTQANLEFEQLKVIQKRIQQRRLVSGSIDPINASQQTQTVTLHVLTQCEFELARKTLSQLVNSQRQPIHITKYWQLLIQRHGYPLQDFFGGTSNAGTTKNQKILIDK